MAVIFVKDNHKAYSASVKTLMRKLQLDKKFKSKEQAEELAERGKERNSKPYTLRIKIFNKVSEFYSHEMQCFLVKPKKKESEKTVLYIHGGGWIDPISPFHWGFVDRGVTALGCDFYVPMYPKYPEYHAPDTIEALMKLYDELLAERPNSEIVLMGDSAGAHLCLVLASIIKNRDNNNLKRVVLFAAPTDISLTNTDIPEVEKKDPMLARVGCAYAAGKWAQPYPINSPEVNPMRGHIKPPVKILHFVGTADLLYPDAVLYDKKCEDEGLDITTYLFENMYHVFPVVPGPQARKAMKIIKESFEE